MSRARLFCHVRLLEQTIVVVCDYCMSGRETRQRPRVSALIFLSRVTAFRDRIPLLARAVNPAATNPSRAHLSRRVARPHRAMPRAVC